MPARGSIGRLSDEESGAWNGFLRAYVRVVRELDADLMRTQQMPLSSYDVLIQLGLAPGHRMQLTALADDVLMSRSGLSRIVDVLEYQGLVKRERRESDGRSFDAVLTPEGVKALRTANKSHLRRVRELFLDRLTDTQLAALGEVWEVLQDDEPEDGQRDPSAQPRRRPRAK